MIRFDSNSNSIRINSNFTDSFGTLAKSKELKSYTSNDSSLNDIDIDFITLNINLNKGKLKIRLIENCYC
jgi:hypothetical protein